LCVFGHEWTELPLGPFETLFWLETMKLPLSNNETAPIVQKKKKLPAANLNSSQQQQQNTFQQHIKASI
jgi:hypothetical protein